jgi:hypothetical protein
MKKIILGLLVSTFLLSSCSMDNEIEYVDTEDVSSQIMEVGRPIEIEGTSLKQTIFVDELGCKWLLISTVYTGSAVSGHPQHHPTCNNPDHKGYHTINQ